MDFNKKRSPQSKTRTDSRLDLGEGFESRRERRFTQSLINRNILLNERMGSRNAESVFSGEDIKFTKSLKTLVQNRWPVLNSRSNNKRVDEAVQTDDYNTEEKYPLWSTKEIAEPVELDLPVYKHNMVSRGTQTECFMFMEGESSSAGTLLPSSSPAQDYKTYSDAVQQERPKLRRETKLSKITTLEEKKTILKVNKVRRNEDLKLSKKFQDSCSVKSCSEKLDMLKYYPVMDNKARIQLNDAVCKEGGGASVSSQKQRTYTKKENPETEELFGCCEINDDKYKLKESGQEKSILMEEMQAENGSLSVGYFGLANEYKTFMYNSHSNFNDSHYSWAEFRKRAMAQEIVALKDFRQMADYNRLFCVGKEEQEPWLQQFLDKLAAHV